MCLARAWDWRLAGAFALRTVALARASWIGRQRGSVSLEKTCATPNGMNDVAFWKLDTLSDRQLLDGLGAVLGSGRRLTAELVAHLGEVEDRRLHLEAACSSMFSYCVNRLGLSEDEACRRIEVARLARRHPAMFPLLASGQLSLSVAALLKPHLSAENRPLDLGWTRSTGSIRSTYWLRCRVSRCSRRARCSPRVSLVRMCRPVYASCPNGARRSHSSGPSAALASPLPVQLRWVLQRLRRPRR